MLNLKFHIRPDPKTIEDSLMLELRAARKVYDSLGEGPSSAALHAHRIAAEHYGRALDAFYRFKRQRDHLLNRRRTPAAP